MAAIQKNFVVKNGLEVNANLLVADNNLQRVGIGTTRPQYLFHVSGGIGATALNVTGVSTVNNINVVNEVLINGVGGSVGQFIGYNTTGLTWASIADIGGVRNTTSFTAAATQSEFNVIYEPDLLDVYINGIKLAPNEFVATDGVTVTLNTPCFGGEFVEFIAFANTAMGIGVSGIPGINVKNNGTLVNTPLSIINLDFIGATISTVGSGVTINVQGNRAAWNVNTAGIHTLSNVGIGTTNPQVSLSVLGGSRFGGVFERVSTATTYISGSSMVLELDCQQSTTYTYTIPASTNIGIVSFKNMLAQTGVANATTVTVIFTQNSAGTGNTTTSTGIGTNITIVGYANGASVTGISTRSLVGSGSTLTLSTTGNDVDFVSFYVYYSGGINTSASSYRVYSTKNGNFR